MLRLTLFRSAPALCAAILLTIALVPAEQPAAQAANPPNILLIVTDDQPLRSLSVMPDTTRLIRDAGINFKNASVPTPLCCPSRASIMTGRYAHNHGVRRQNGRALDQSTTIQRYLHDAGYQTAAVGKFLNTLHDNSGNPHRPDYFDRWAIMRTANFPYRDYQVNDLGEVRTEPTYSTTFIANRTVDFLSEFDELDDAAPWYAWVGFQAPHQPRDPQRKYRRAPVPAWQPPPSVGERRRDKPPWVRESHVTVSRGSVMRTETLRTLMSVDDQVGRLVNTLEALGELANTIVVFTSDNGYLWSDHGARGKRFPYRSSVKIPLYVTWPAQLPAGEISKSLVSNIDLAPMFLNAAGLPPPTTPPMDGRSPLTGPPRKRLHVEYFKDVGPVPTWAATLRNRSYYIESYDEAGKRIFKEFYRLKDDPWMLRNVFRDGLRGNRPDSERRLLLELKLQNDRQCAGPTCP